MSKLLVFAALLLSLVVPGGAVAIAAFSTPSGQETIELPVTPEPSSPAPSSTPEAETETFKLFGGRSIRVDPECADERRLDERRQQAVAAANRMPPVRQKLLNAERDLTDAERPFRRFLDQHPESDLAADDFATYTALKNAYEARHKSYGAALKAHNRQVDVFNGLADSYNTDLRACEA